MFPHLFKQQPCSPRCSSFDTSSQITYSFYLYILVGFIFKICPESGHFLQSSLGPPKPMPHHVFLGIFNRLFTVLPSFAFASVQFLTTLQLQSSCHSQIMALFYLKASLYTHKNIQKHCYQCLFLENRDGELRTRNEETFPLFQFSTKYMY